MRKFVLIGSLSLITALSACTSGTAEFTPENVGKVLAETGCLLFDDTLESGSITTETEAIFARYGFSPYDEIDAYVTEIQGTEAQNELSVVVRDHLESTCGDAITETGLTAADLAEAMVFE